MGRVSALWYLGHLMPWHMAVRRQVSWTVRVPLIRSAAKPMASLSDESPEVSSLGIEFKSDSRNFHCAKN